MKTRRSVVIFGLAALLGGVTVWAWPNLGPTVHVRAGESVQEAIDAAAPGATVLLGPGSHRGPIEVSKTIALRGEEGAEIVAPAGADVALMVTAPGVEITDLTVRGGWTGIELHRARDARLADIVVRGAESEGILVYAAPGRVERADVGDLTSPHAQGIEVLSAPDTVVTGSTVEGGKIGIVAHLSHVVFEDNLVTGTTGVGVMIREMSKGAARDNIVTDAAGAGLYCGDMSVCEFRDNRTSGISAAHGSAVRSSAGWGLVVHYYATASSTGDQLDAQAGRIAVLSGSRLSDRSPLEPGMGWGAMLPAGIATAVALMGLTLVVLLIGPVARRFLPQGLGVGANRRRAFAIALMAGLVAQSFHMVEHLVQVFRVYWDGVPSRGSLVGSVVDTEWVHFTYNALVFLAIATVVSWRHSGWVPRRAALGDRLMVTALLVQGYHVVEHSLKVFQHVTTGAKVNPGILGSEVNLVWLHFGINLAVYVAFALACAAYLWPLTARRPVSDHPALVRPAQT